MVMVNTFLVLDTFKFELKKNRLWKSRRGLRVQRLLIGLVIKCSSVKASHYSDFKISTETTRRCSHFIVISCSLVKGKSILVFLFVSPFKQFFCASVIIWLKLICRIHLLCLFLNFAQTSCISCVSQLVVPQQITITCSRQPSQM